MKNFTSRGLAGLVAAAALVLTPFASSFVAPVTVQARQQQSLDGCDFITSGGFLPCGFSQ
jgi:hypothetical protein